MSDDLIKRLEKVLWSVNGEPNAHGNVDEICAKEAKERIEQLERDQEQGAKDYCALMEKHDALHVKLAKAVEAMRMAVKMWQKPDNADPNIRLDNCIDAIVSIVPVLMELEKP